MHRWWVVKSALALAHLWPIWEGVQPGICFSTHRFSDYGLIMNRQNPQRKNPHHITCSSGRPLKTQPPFHPSSSIVPDWRRRTVLKPTDFQQFHKILRLSCVGQLVSVRPAVRLPLFVFINTNYLSPNAYFWIIKFDLLVTQSSKFRRPTRADGLRTNGNQMDPKNARRISFWDPTFPASPNFEISFSS